MGLVSRLSAVVQENRREQPKSGSVASVSSNFDVVASRVPQSDNYVDKLLRNTEQLPPITWSNWHKEVRWFNLSVIVITPLVALYGAATTRLDARTFYFCVFYYVFNMIGESWLWFVSSQCTLL